MYLIKKNAADGISPGRERVNPPPVWGRERGTSRQLFCSALNRQFTGKCWRQRGATPKCSPLPTCSIINNLLAPAQQCVQWRAEASNTDWHGKHIQRCRIFIAITKLTDFPTSHFPYPAWCTPVRGCAHTDGHTHTHTHTHTHSGAENCKLLRGEVGSLGGCFSTD